MNLIATEKLGRTPNVAPLQRHVAVYFDNFIPNHLDLPPLRMHYFGLCFVHSCRKRTKSAKERRVARCARRVREDWPEVRRQRCVEAREGCREVGVVIKKVYSTTV